MQREIMYNYVILLLISLLGLWGVSCSSSQETTSRPAGEAEVTDFYTTAFPHRDVSSHLRDAQKAIIRIISTSHYTTYVFEKPEIRLADIQTNKLQDLTSQQYSNDESTAGTSIILDINNKGNTLLITCAHAVNSPDTLISYFFDERNSPGTFIETVSIKKRQTNLLFTPSELSNFEVIAENRLSDLALLSASLNSDTRSEHESLPFSMGRMEH